MSKANVIAVEELRLGMFVQLEGGWLSHPFSLSAFKLSSAEQINTLRRLGLAQVRWVPEKSDTPAAAAPPPLEVTALPAAEHHETMPSDTRARDLQLQRESARRCDEQRSKAESELRELLVVAKTRPQEAGRASAALTQSMLDNMLHEDEVGIRLVATSSDRELAHA